MTTIYAADFGEFSGPHTTEAWDKAISPIGDGDVVARFLHSIPGAFANLPRVLVSMNGSDIVCTVHRDQLVVEDEKNSLTAPVGLVRKALVSRRRRDTDNGHVVEIC